jgi:cation:H+ antiporter
MDGSTILLFVAGGVALTIGADALVRGASALAARFGVTPLVVGLTVVAFGTSAPELFVSASSAWQGNPDVAFGNVVGSNIFNVLFILGACALIAPLVVDSRLMKQDVPAMIGASLLTWLLAADGVVGRTDGVVLMAFGVAYTAHLIVEGRRAAKEGGAPPAAPKGRAWLHPVLVVAGLVLLVLGSDWFVEGATRTAKSFGVSDLVVGLTIVAAGTSLPEVATSIAATFKGERDIAVGNVVGSNIFNIFMVLGVSATIAKEGVPVSDEALRIHVPVMTATACACLPVFLSDSKVARSEGALFLFGYVAYVAYLILAATDGDRSTAFARALTNYAVPATAGLLLVEAWRRRSPRKVEA